MGDYQQMPRLILNQLRWLDHLVDGKVVEPFHAFVTEN